MATSIDGGTAGPDRLELYLQAARPTSLLTSLLPCLAGGLVAIASGRATWWLLPVALIALLFLHAGTNAANDVEDAVRGVDAADKMRNSGVFNTGLMPTREGRRFYAACFGVAFLLGVAICVEQGPALLVIGVIGILGGLLYTAGPWPYKYVGLGEPLIVMLMGPLITQGSYTAVTGAAFSAPAFWVGLGPGLLIAGVLSANNLEDIVDDAGAGVRTLAVRLGFARGRLLYVLALTAIIPVQLILWLSGLFDAWILLPLLTLPGLLSRIRGVLSADGPASPGVDGLTGRTGQLHALFSLLLCVGVALARAL